MDPNTSSNYDAWLTRHTTASLVIDFARERLGGLVTLELESQTEKGSKEIILDTSHVDVSSVKVDSADCKWKIKERSEPNGSPMHIAVPDGASRGKIVKVDIEVSTTDKCTALQWLTPEQTSNKTAPFVFSQCQAIHARSIFPCQDTPSVKSTYTFKLTSPHMVVASGVAQGSPQNAASSSSDKLYTFEQKVAIPSYLVALASGDIALAPIGSRSRVATGPNELKAAQWEFERDMDRFLNTAESLCGPYQWGEYNVLVMPPSFPYGGMENPIFTFATPTLIAGDRENVDVIAHELAHSWSGNLVTSKSWEHFWLNEGWTVYIERRIIAAVHGDAHFDFSAVIGWKSLESSIKSFGDNHPFTQLLVDHEGIDPDDAFSTVPYEKGFHFIWMLEKVVGRENFDKFIPHYFSTWANKSLDSYDFKATFLDFFRQPEYKSLGDDLSRVDWEGRFRSRGLPPKPRFNTELIDVCYKLAEQWKNPSYEPASKDVESWTANQKVVFLGSISDFADSDFPLASKVDAMGHAYGMLDSKNVEVLAAYYAISLRAKVQSQYQQVADLLGRVGRMKFVRPLYKSLNKVDRDLAVKTFEKNRMFYHPICRQLVEKDLEMGQVQ